MALSNTNITPSAWTKIGDNISSITFQNQGSYPIEIEITAADTAPAVTDSGIVYGTYEGEMKKDLTDLTYVSSPAYVWAKSITANADVVYEGA